MFLLVQIYFLTLLSLLWIEGELMQKNNHFIDLIFVIALFFLFSFSACTMILLGANIYQKTLNNLNHHFDSNTVPMYLVEKIHQNDSAQSVSIEMIENQSVLQLTQNIQDISYSTYLYTFDGYLYELFTRSDLDFSFSDGQRILPLDSISFSWKSSQLLEIKTYSNIEKNRTYYISLMSKQAS